MRPRCLYTLALCTGSIISMVCTDCHFAWILVEFYDWSRLINFMLDIVRKGPTPVARAGRAESRGSGHTLDVITWRSEDSSPLILFASNAGFVLIVPNARPLCSTSEHSFTLSHGCNHQTRKQPLWCFVEQKVGKTPTAIRTYIWLRVSASTAMNKT